MPANNDVLTALLANAQTREQPTAPRRRRRGGLAGIWGLAATFSVVLVSVILVSVTQPANAIGATPLSSSNGSVVVGVFVPLGAMCLPCVIDTRQPAPDILGLSDRLQMGRVEASPVSTQVVNLKSLGFRAVAKFVGKVVAVEPLGFAIHRPSTDSVAVNLSSGPNPTLVGIAGEYRHSLVEIHSGYHIPNIPTLVLGVNPRGLYGA